MLLFSIEFSEYGATMVSKLRLRSMCTTIYNLPLYLDRSTSTF